MANRPTRPWQSDHHGAKPPKRRGVARVRRVDLHGYDVLSATDVAMVALREAYANGYQHLELLHGAADVVDPVEAGGGRGGIKWELRRMLDRGQFDAYCRNRNEHALLEGMMRLAIKPNPQPQGERWTDPPKPAR